MTIRRRSVVKSLAGLPALGAVEPREFAARFSGGERPWIGPDFWSNPLQDWRVSQRRLECIGAGGDRNVYLLTRELDAREGTFTCAIETGRLSAPSAAQLGWVGFRIGVRGAFADYRDSALRGYGLEAGVTAAGQLFIGEPPADTAPRVTSMDKLRISLSGKPTGGGKYELTLHAGDQKLIRRDVPGEWVTGGLALVCHSGPMRSSPPPIEYPTEASGGNKWGTQRGGTMRFWFREWRVFGTKVSAYPERAWGPILFTQYTLSGGVLKLTAQLAPVEDFARGAALQVKEGAAWKTVARARIDSDSATARFRVERWSAAHDVPFRVVFGSTSYTGTIRHDPKEKQRLAVGALTCQNDHGFPHAPIARNLAHLKPDLLLFTGDQIYERNGEYGIQRTPDWAARLDYLRKWFLFGWAWGELTRHTPTVCLPDDHDVYHGNIWGSGGRKAEGTGPEGQDSGGYTMPAGWVQMVERTQSSHLPDSPDASPVDQGIGVHYGHLRVGRVSFALLEDRKWKSAPKFALPEAKIYNGWPQNPAYDAAKHGDVAGAQLLGPRQEKFLEEWALDWSGDVRMKAVVSATILCNLATLPATATNDSVVPGLAISAPDEYIEGDKVTMDHDSNAWPQTPRNRVVRAMAKCLSVHIAGDQHLASTIQYGASQAGDGPFAICTPAISNIFPRRWFPPSRRQFGVQRDGFGNIIDVRAVANPQRFGIAPEPLNNRAPGFGVVVFDTQARTVEFTNWPRSADLTKPDAKPYAGWPITVRQEDNGMSAAPNRLKLPEPLAGEAVLEVVEQATGEVARCWRAKAGTSEVRVWRPGRYTVRRSSVPGALTASAWTLDTL